MTQHQTIRAAVVALSTRPQRAPWLPRPVRSALDAWRLRVAIGEHA
jgi:hypothetical protein